jgi:cysteinyl-tRNA synthetase
MKSHSWKKPQVLLACLSFLAAPMFGLDPRLATVNDWLYVLQPNGVAEITALTASDFDLVVMDYSDDGSADGEFSPAQIATLKASGKVVLAYLSIGEAETYRYYWDPNWNDQPAPDPDAPAWLGDFNPLFPDNYKVRYWDADWQAIIFGTSAGPSPSYLDRIVAQGFDGIYLDIIDAFTFWSDAGEKTRLEARTDMLAFLSNMASHAREALGVSNFLFFPQNGLDMIWDDASALDALGTAYLDLVDGAGVEDLYYDELAPQDPGDTNFRQDLLADYLSIGDGPRLILTTDYLWDDGAPSSPANIARYNDFENRCLLRGYIPYAALPDRDLDEILTIDAGGGLLEAQPKANSTAFFADGFESGDISAFAQ